QRSPGHDYDVQSGGEHGVGRFGVDIEVELGCCGDIPSAVVRSAHHRQRPHILGERGVLDYGHSNVRQRPDGHDVDLARVVVDHPHQSIDAVLSLGSTAGEIHPHPACTVTVDILGR